MASPYIDALMAQLAATLSSNPNHSGITPIINQIKAAGSGVGGGKNPTIGDYASALGGSDIGAWMAMFKKPSGGSGTRTSSTSRSAEVDRTPVPSSGTPLKTKPSRLSMAGAIARPYQDARQELVDPVTGVIVQRAPRTLSVAGSMARPYGNKSVTHYNAEGQEVIGGAGQLRQHDAPGMSPLEKLLAQRAAMYQR